MPKVNAVSTSDDGLRALTIEQALDLTGISRPKLYLEIKQGHIAARKIGRRTFILASDLREYLISRPRLKTAKATE